MRKLALALLTASALCGPAAAQSFVIASGTSMDLPSGGSIDLGCIELDVQGELNLNAGQFSTSSNAAIASSGVLNGGQGTLRVGGHLSNSGTFNAQLGSVVMGDGCVGTASQISGSFVFQNLSLTSSTARTFLLPAGGQITVLGTLTIQGAPGQNVQLMSADGGTAVIQLGPQAKVVTSFADVLASVRIDALASGNTHAVPSLGAYALMTLSLLLAACSAGLLRCQEGHAGRSTLCRPGWPAAAMGSPLG
ncbi:MAG: IPTL-CTERM sorting domain-containing protein [Burkholderiales bacterium]|nr:IPTL-CTERM sorting domain-containing protein [Burkholderiales bacterium]